MTAKPIPKSTNSPKLATSTRSATSRKSVNSAKSSPAAQAAAAPKNFRIRRLRRSELPTDTVALARFLVGKAVVRELPEGRVSGRIVETEAYPPGDPAGHHFRGPTPRIRSMYLAPGHAYVFFNYGAHFMLNVSAEPAGSAGGILIRALEPLEGIELMKKNRGCDDLLGPLLALTRGPGRLAAALRITRAEDGIDLCAVGKLWLGEINFRGAGKLRDASANGSSGDAAAAAKAVLGETVRIGISRAADRVLRFYEAGNPFVSGPKRLLVPPTPSAKAISSPGAARDAKPAAPGRAKKRAKI